MLECATAATQQRECIVLFESFLFHRLFNKLRALRTIINALLSALVMVSQVYP